MTRRREKEEDLSELIQFLDDEVGGSSSAGDDSREPKLEPKHKIFLSHSGAQKDFTEQLCVDLERWQYYPFFDKRPDSLPKGRQFPHLIFQAAKQCQVLVLILSEEFFTRTKWPMLELEAFVEAQKIYPRKSAILPVYLGISRDECTKNETKRAEWHLLWRKWAEIDERIDVGKWKDALEILGPSNGIEYVKSMGEVMLRKEIVSAICNLVPTEISWSSTQIHGRTRICKAILERLKWTKPSSMYGVRIVGVYGMGGVGKTTFCKVLCDELNMKFQGNVCHGELGSRSSLELQKQVLRDLTDVNHGSLSTLTSEDMTTNLLRRRIRQQQVFLALDNVWQHSMEEAKVYLRIGFHNGSIVMVTARSIDLLLRLNIDESDCLEMPELEEEDAKYLFLDHAAPGLQFISKDDEQKIQHCVRQCKFRKGANLGEHFHPLALKVLGAQLGSLGLNPEIWVENISKEDKFNQFREKEHPIFSILQRGYDSLLEEDQHLFMDGVLFHPSQRLSHFMTAAGEDNRDYRHRVRLDIYEWLSIVHRTSTTMIKNRLKGLKAKSLLEDIGDGFSGMSIHDLYLEFVKLEVKRENLDLRRWVWYNGEYPTDLEQRPSGYCWQNIKRVAAKYTPWEKGELWMGTIGGIKWHYFSNIVVLQLFINIHEVLDLQGLRCLRSLEVEWGQGSTNVSYPHDEVEGSNDLRYRGKGEGKLIGLGELSNLGWLKLRNIHYAPCIKEIGCLTTLEVLRLNTFCFHTGWVTKCEREPLLPPDLDKCIHLRELVLEDCRCMKAFPDLSKLRLLRRVLFIRCESAKELVGLTSRMCAIQELSLVQCTSLYHMPGFSDLVSLQELCVTYCDNLQELPDFRKLTNIQRLDFMGHNNVVRGFSESMLLQDLVLWKVDGLPDLPLLRHLERLHIRAFLGSMLPPFGNFTALEELHMVHLPKVRNLPDMHKLSRLKRFRINGACNLLLQPTLGDLMALQELRLLNCGSSVGIAVLPNLNRLTNLQILELDQTPIKSLPSLEHLTQLRELSCSSTQLVELPDLNGLILLERLVLTSCLELRSLDNLANLPALEYLNVKGCHMLERLPDLRSFKRLHHLNLCRSGVLLSSEDIEVLGALMVPYVIICEPFKLNLLEMLEGMSLHHVVMSIEARQLRFLAKNPTDRRASLCRDGCCGQY